MPSTGITAALKRVMAQQEANLRGDAWETTKEVQRLAQLKMQDILQETIYRFQESKYYDRTNDFINSITTEITQGHGTYSIYLWFDSNQWTRTKKGHPIFNAHADWRGNYIEEDLLVNILDDRSGFIETYTEWLNEYAVSEFSKRMRIKFGRR